MADLFELPVESRPLRPHQVRAMEMLRRSFGLGHRRPMMMMPTGAGKTRLAAEIIKGACAKGHRVMFAVPRIALVDQTIESFESEGLRDIGVMQANHPRTDRLAGIQIASVQTLKNRMPKDPFGLVIVDEAHERAEPVYRMMKEWPGCRFIGLSATPWTRGLGLQWDDLLLATNTAELIDAGFLSKFVVYAPDVPDLSGVRTVGGDYVENELSEAMSGGKLIASVVETWLAKGENRPTLCFGASRAHAENLMMQFRSHGISAAYCDCNTDRIEMQMIGREFISGAVKIVCSNRKLTTGIDWPVSCIIDAMPTQSESLHVQKIGRGLRINPGTEDCVVFDHAGNTLRLGMVTDIHHETLDKTEKGKPAPRKKVEKLPRECANCAALMTGRVCPYCGHEHKPAPGVETVDGDLVEVTGKKGAPSKDEKQRFWSMALWLDDDRGRGGKLAAGLYKGKFDVWPRGLSDSRLRPDQAFWNYEKSRRIAYAKRMAKMRDGGAEARA